MSITEIRTYIYKKKHRSGRATWIIKWLDPETNSWLYKTAGRTHNEAKLVEARVRESLFRGENPYPQHSDQKDITISELVAIFYQSPRYLNASPRWRFVIKAQLDKVICPDLGAKRFANLKREDLLKLYLKLKANGLAHSTIQKYHLKFGLLAQIFLERFPGSINPVQRVTDFSRLFPKQAPTRDINFLTPPELERIYVELRKSRSAAILPLVQFLANSGLRRSEALALRWSDIDYDSGFIQIRQSKNASVRRVPLETASLEALSMLSKVSEYVFTKPNGERYHKDSFLKPLQRAVKRAEIKKRIDIHCLRHSWGSNKIRAGWGLRKVSQILGHSDVSITSEVYTHLLDGDLCVRDEFHFDKDETSANIRKLEGLKNVSNSMDNILSVFGSDQNLAALRPLLASAIQDAISNQKHSNVTKPQDSARMAEDPQFSPHVLRRAQKGASDLASVARPVSNLSNDFNELEWCARYESNVRPSASEADALSN